ncbi:MAG: hypothetical protein QNJ04_02750 [Desulfobacterales bacterium]|nr:hypothetical protein [Desulfobacterales bacterium]
MIRPFNGRTGPVLAALAAALLFGCTALKPKSVVPPPPQETNRASTPPKVNKTTIPTRGGKLPIAHFRNRSHYVHEVRWPNESLVLIAQWYTGSRANWKAIAKATPNLRNNRLYKGHVVFIPIDLLQIETPMPKQYVQQRPTPTSAPPPAAPPSDDYEPRPYGPRPYPKKTTP